MSRPAVETFGLSRRFAGHIDGIRDLTLSLPPSSVLLLVGPNGAGKTTVLRLLSTLLRPTRGRASICGFDLVREAARIRERVVFLGTTHGMYEALTPRENLAFAASMSGQRIDRVTSLRHSVAALLDPLLERAGLAHVADRPLRVLSQGMKRRLALARVWLQQPHILLLDEPFTGLDANGQVLVEALISDVTREGGAVILATHEWERGIRLAHAVAALDGGRQVAFDREDPARAPRPVGLEVSSRG